MVELPDRAIERVLDGFPIVYPTTTLPALGCLPEAALDRLFELKKRSGTKVVSLGVCDIEQASTLVEIPDCATEILSDFPALTKTSLDLAGAQESHCVPIVQ